MKTTRKYLAVLTAFLLCIGLFAGCSGESDSYTETENNSEEASDSPDVTEASAVSEDIIGKVSSVGDSCLTLSAYEVADSGLDYSTLDLSSLTEAGLTEYVYPEDTAEYYFLSDGEWTPAAYEDITVGSVVAVTTDTYGIQEFIILQAAEEEVYTEEAEEESEETDNLSLSPDDYTIGQVTAVNDDGSLMLLYHTTTDVTIDDVVNLDVTQFTSEGVATEYVIPEDSIVYWADEGMLTELEAEFIMETDMLLIYTDSDETTNIIVYSVDSETEGDE